MNSIAKTTSAIITIGMSFLAIGVPFGPRQDIERAKPERVDFERDIYPVLEERCFDCHGPEKQEAQLRLDAKTTFAIGGDSGKLVHEEAAKSLLYRRIAGIGDDDQMPPDEPLTEKQIRLVLRWIERGANWPDAIGADEPRPQDHWAYVAPKQSPLPQVVQKSWIKNPIDHFVLSRLEREQLQPSATANKPKLLRRLYLDLIGIPPSVEQIDAFLGDESHTAYENVVDRLLASQHYGQRWATPWLDGARYADSNGFQADQYREVWPYRDWVINAINNDMPFDQFTIEQLAGDLLPNSTISQRIATGFHRQTTCNVEAGVDPEQNRINQVIDRVNTTGTVWLGTTLECAQCHNHKYDPFTQRDYYRLFAYFNNTPVEVKHTTATTFDFYGPKLNVPLPPDATSAQRDLKKRLIAARDGLSELIARLVDRQPGWETVQRKRLEQASTDHDSPWIVANPIRFTSTGGASHTMLADNSILVGGKRPDKDTYRVEMKVDVSKISAIRLEALIHPSLPGEGPGRHHPERPNFVLNQFGFSIKSGNADQKKNREVGLTTAWADYSHPDYQVSGAIDGNDSTGWAIHKEFHQPHVAIFEPTVPATIATTDELIFNIKQNHGGSRTLGRLRISVCQNDDPPNSARADDSLPANIVEILMIAASGRTEDQQADLMDYFQRLQPEFLELERKVTQLKMELGESLSATSLVMVEDQMRETFVLDRGDFRSPKGKVSPGTPAILHKSSEETSGDRLEFAKWLVSDQNPLTARVIVNRWWQEFFGNGIVRTPEDFGTRGARPTHPGLLDWLAVELIENGWSRKKIHKLIVMSATYRQDSRFTDQLQALDPGNRLLARGSRFRLSAELIRDNALAISGLLCETMGGPPIYPPQPNGVWRHVGRNAPKYQTDTDEDRFRRGLYVVWRRSAPYPSFVNFDAPDRASCVVKRSRANTPLQALSLLNDEAYVEMSWGFAREIAARSGNDIEQKIRFAFRCCVARQPTTEELQLLSMIHDDELSSLSLNQEKTRKLIGNTPLPRDTSAVQFAAWFFVANVLLNLDETITRD